MFGTVLQGQNGSKFEVNGYGLRLQDGRFVARFRVTEHRGSDALDQMHDTDSIFDTEEDAAFEGAQLGARWVADHYGIVG
ncbi:hypothetical protein ABXN37_08705 [Piscinibacter sakaiensis]|uniref:hypothetical protein n=1 Tax=Piscinibacter sakaiensis TaxID=1547922 RepID=UPI0026D5C491